MSVSGAVLFLLCNFDVVGLTVLAPMDVMHLIFLGFKTMRTSDGMQSPFTCHR